MKKVLMMILYGISLGSFVSSSDESLRRHPRLASIAYDDSKSVDARLATLEETLQSVDRRIHRIDGFLARLNYYYRYEGSFINKMKGFAKTGALTAIVGAMLGNVVRHIHNNACHNGVMPLAGWLCS